MRQILHGFSLVETSLPAQPPGCWSGPGVPGWLLIGWMKQCLASHWWTQYYLLCHLAAGLAQEGLAYCWLVERNWFWLLIGQYYWLLVWPRKADWLLVEWNSYWLLIGQYYLLGHDCWSGPWGLADGWLVEGNSYWLLVGQYYLLSHLAAGLAQDDWLIADWLKETVTGFSLVNITCSATWLLVWPRSAWLDRKDSSSMLRLISTSSLHTIRYFYLLCFSFRRKGRSEKD